MKSQIKLHTISRSKYIDPICGMSVTPESAAGHYEHNGETIYFCSQGCLEKYKTQVGASETETA